MKTTDTKYFGTVEYDPADTLTFPKGLFGFETEHQFLLLPFSGNGTLFCLQSLTTPRLAFVMMDPFSLTPDYAPILQPDELKSLDTPRSEDLNYYVMCVVRDPVSASTVNLRCPVAVNDAGTAIQVILEDTAYHMRHQLAEFSRDDDEPSEGDSPADGPDVSHGKSSPADGPDVSHGKSSPADGPDVSHGKPSVKEGPSC